MNKNFVKGSLTCLKPEVIQERINTEFPLMLNIEPTNECNAKCYYCPRDITAKVKGVNFINFELYKSIIDQIKEHKLIMLNLHKDGEPLLHKQLPEMIKYAKDKNAADIIHFNTNGTLLDKNIARRVLESGLDDMTISIDAAYEETYQRLKKLNGLEKLEEKIRNFIKLRDEMDAPTFIRVKIMEFEGVSKEEIETFQSRWKGVADQVQVTGVHSWSGAIEDFKITDEQVSERYPCALLWYLLAVNANGEVSICNVDWNYTGVVGNAITSSVKDIWSGKKIKLFRQAQINGVWNCPEICDECVVGVSVGNMWDYFKTRTDFI